MSTLWTYAATGPGPLQLSLPAGSARMVVNPNVDQAFVELTTDAASGPAADAVRNAAGGRTSDGEFFVTVPEVDRGTASPSGRTVTNSISGGVFHGGVIQSGFTNGRPSQGTPDEPPLDEIRATVIMPPHTKFSFVSSSAGLICQGHLVDLDCTTVTGDLSVESVAVANISNVAGGIEIGTASDRMSVSSTSGDISVSQFCAQEGIFRNVSGGTTVMASDDALGLLNASSISGDITVHGGARLIVRISSLSGQTIRFPIS